MAAKPKPVANRQTLSISRTGKPKAGALGKWLATNEDALSFVDDFLDMRKEGTCDWSLPELVNYLRKHYAMPPISASALQHWFDANRTEKWRCF